jgi:hypothetical protein
VSIFRRQACSSDEGFPRGVGVSGKNGEAKNPFQFMACWELREMLGRRAADAQELLDGLDEVPLDSIYFHTHSYFLRHPYIAGPYPNDFANWAAIQLRDRVLGERLAVIDPSEVGDLEGLRNELVTIIDDHLSHVGYVPRVVYGELFFFMQSRILAVPAGIKVRRLFPRSSGDGEKGKAPERLRHLDRRQPRIEGSRGPSLRGKPVRHEPGRRAQALGRALRESGARGSLS